MSVVVGPRNHLDRTGRPRIEGGFFVARLHHPRDRAHQLDRRARALRRRRMTMRSTSPRGIPSAPSRIDGSASARCSLASGRDRPRRGSGAGARATVPAGRLRPEGDRDCARPPGARRPADHPQARQPRMLDADRRQRCRAPRRWLAKLATPEPTERRQPRVLRAQTCRGNGSPYSLATYSRFPAVILGSVPK